MRKKPNLEVRMQRAADYLVSDPSAHRGNWKRDFDAEQICLEIGCGKGRFITESAKLNPDIFFVGMEREQGVLVMAMELAKAHKIKNLIFINGDAGALNGMFAPEEVSRICLNFSDPWPKKKQAKRRLTHKNFLSQYNEILDEAGEIHFKTDNEKLFEFSLNEMSDFGLRLSNITFDLHSTEFPNVITEYEERFSEQGIRINRVEARKR